MTAPGPCAFPGGRCVYDECHIVGRCCSTGNQPGRLGDVSMHTTEEGWKRNELTIRAEVPVRKVAAYIPVSTEVLADAQNLSDVLQSFVNLDPRPIYGPPAPPFYGPALPTSEDIEAWLDAHLDPIAAWLVDELVGRARDY